MYPVGYCGPIALSHALSQFGITADPHDLAKLAGWTPEWGTTREGLIRAAQHYGVTAVPVENTTLDYLNEQLATDHPVIVNYMDRGWGTDDYTKNINPSEDGHYAVFLGFENGLVKLHCNYRGGYTEPCQEFEDYWYDILQNGTRSSRWALILYPADVPS
jgi:ABC-type bacteriocin/lantibiotic exporter with double-glycine peptidase domain